MVDNILVTLEQATIDQYVLFSLVALPLFGALLLIATPSSRTDYAKIIATTIALITMLLSVYVFVSYDHGISGFQFNNSWKWLSIPGPWILGTQGISFNVGVDGISALMVMLTGMVMFTGTIVSWSITNRPKDYFILYLALLSGVFGVFISLDLFFLFFFYELAVMPMYLLIGIWGSSSDFGSFIRTKEYGAMKLTLYLVAGSVLIWIALLAIFVEAGLGTFSLIDLQNKGDFSSTFQQIFFPFLMVGFGILAGLWPFHTWSPDGHVAAPTSVSMVHAGVLMKLGAYGILRVGIGLFPDGAESWMPVLLVLGTANVIYGAVSAMGQHDLKYVVGYSSVSHMGYVIVGLATLNHVGITGSVLQMFSHGIMTALLFVIVGSIYDRTHTRDIDVLEGLAGRMGTTTSFFIIGGLTSLGLPGLSGFVSELLVFIGLFQTYPVAGILSVIGATITAIYILRLIAKVFFGSPSHEYTNKDGILKADTFSSLILTFFLFLLGLFPFPFIEAVDGSIVNILDLFTSAK